MPPKVITQVKSGLQKRFGQSGIYQRAKASWIYGVFWKLANPQVISDRESEIKFYTKLLPGIRKGSLIFDVGANQGYKSDIFLRMGAQVVAVEPDETSQTVLKQKFLDYRLKKLPFTIVDGAVSDTRGEVTMLIDAPGSAKNTLSTKWVDTLRSDPRRFGQTLSFDSEISVQTTTLDDLIRKFGKPYFIKIDVEGHEPSVLRGLRQTVPFVSFEVNLPEFVEDGAECIRMLEKVDPSCVFNLSIDCRKGLELERWLGASDFQNAYRSCKAESVEVYCKMNSKPPA
jgi:FkbM family methyltransferase